jgi:glutamate-5-semialdehyde dehydrogenase
MTLRERVTGAAAAASRSLGLPAEVRNAALDAMAQALGAGTGEILAANDRDLAAARESGLPAPILGRLAFDEKKMAASLAGIAALRGMPDPVGRVLEARLLDRGLTLTRVSCPIGLVAMIFESRPDALVQMAALAARSGNAVVLKGGSEAKHTNRILASILARAGTEAGLPADWLVSLESRDEVAELLAMHEHVDLVIPRGSKEFVARIMETSRIPVLGHSDGVCHVYLHGDADPAMAADIAVDSKIQYPAACNAAEVLLVDAAFVPRGLAPVLGALLDSGVALELCPRSMEAFAGAQGARDSGMQAMHASAASGGSAPVAPAALPVSPAVRPFEGDDWSVEYLDMRIAVRIVDGLEAAISHVNRYGSGHTDAIVCTSVEAARRFMDAVDSSSVFHNASTRFADGYRYGLGAEVGIATGKLHARGPMGVAGLLTYKWKLEGSGQIVADYASGRSSFLHQDIPMEEGR